MSIVVVDYGVGNLGSIPNMLGRIGAAALVSDDPAIIAAADKLILPGVGAFDAGMRRLRERSLVAVLDERRQAGIPILGLCLGMQLLFDSSEEGDEPGLGWLSGKVQRFRFVPPLVQLPVPHMGWNAIEVTRPGPLLADLGDEPRFYFAHSFHAVCDDPGDVVAVSTYGYPFPSIIHRDRVHGAQFHPEKSHRFGLQLLGNFARL